MTISRTAYDLAFLKSPIVLTGGLAENIPGGMLPVVLLTQPLAFAAGLLTGGSSVSLDNFFATFTPVPGGDIISNDIGRYPFANQGVAGNAIIAQPLQLQMRMIVPAKGAGGYIVKTATMLTLKYAIDQHNQRGGTYTVLTPSNFYTNGILKRLSDAGSGESKQLQMEWVWDFEFPLITLAAAQSAQNNLMAKLTGGAQVSGEPSWSGISPTVGTPSSLAGPSLLPSATSTAGTGIAGLGGIPPT